MKTGRYTLLRLFTLTQVEQIIIPELQRDYVWEKRNVEGLVNSIVSNFSTMKRDVIKFENDGTIRMDSDMAEYLNEQYWRLRYSTRVGFIYAYRDMSAPGQYFLIDGQQRMTTLFLLLLALGRKADPERFRRIYFPDGIPVFDYKVRDVSHRFLSDFIEFELSKTKPSSRFRDSYKYYDEYDSDITAKSIYRNYYEAIVPAIEHYDCKALLDYVENYVEFNYFDTNISQQGERLYLYMNSRGESLSSQERIKSLIVNRSKDDKLGTGRVWEDWQNFYWRNRAEGDKNADRGFLEFLRWAVILHISSSPDSNLRDMSADGPKKSSTEMFEYYIRIVDSNDQNAAEKRLEQELLISRYINDNDSFDISWLRSVQNAIERLLEVSSKYPTVRFLPDDYEVDTPESPRKNNDWLKGMKKAVRTVQTIQYVSVLGLVSYIKTFPDIDDVNVVRMGMYLKNLQSNYLLRRNPDNAVIRTLAFVKEMEQAGLSDIRLLGSYLQRYTLKDEGLFADRQIVDPRDKRLGYYLLDWQVENNSCGKTGGFGYWEKFFWQITDNKALNDFLRGNHNILIKIMEIGSMSREEVLERFDRKISDRRDNDSLRHQLLQYGDISIYDEGGSDKLGVKMERWCLLGNNRDETYWHQILNAAGRETAVMIHSYLSENTCVKKKDRMLAKLGESLGYMNQKYYLWHDQTGQKLRVTLLHDKQTSIHKTRELVIDVLHRHIKGSWVWSYNFCVLSFKSGNSGLIVTDTHDQDYFLDIWYDWGEKECKWYMRLGHRGRSLTPREIDAVRESFKEVSLTESETNGFIRLETADPVIIETLQDDYFVGVYRIMRIFPEVWRRLSSVL